MALEFDIEELKIIVTPIAEKYGVKRISLFGSRARGDNKSGSDYDFSIVPEDDMSIFALSGMLADLEDALHSEVDIVCEDSVSPDFLTSIISDRKILYEI